MAISNRKDEGNTDFLIDLNFEKRIQSFFQEILPFPLLVELAILSDTVYSKDINSTSMAELHALNAEEKIKTLKGVAEKKRDKVYVRKVGSRINLVQTMREFLKAYYPKVPKQRISEAAEVFANAYRCYVCLFDEKDLRQFFMSLCTEKDMIFKLTGLPKQL